MRIKNITKFILFTVLSILILPTTLLFAQTTPPQVDYTVLQDLPGISGPTSLQNYLPSAFNLAVGIAVGLAFVMIVYGGVMYATSDALSNKSAGRDAIENAVWGLLLVIGAYTILYTINPQILNFDLNIKRTVAQNTTVQPITVVSGNCTNCVQIAGLKSGSIGARSNNNISSAMLPKIMTLDAALAAKNISWVITEAYPPWGTVSHRSVCHTNGTCIDAHPINQSAGYLNEFSAAALAAGASKVDYEVKTQAEKDLLIQQKYTGSIIVVPWISGPHFSVYN